MAIGTTAALLGSAVIGAGASMAGASSNSKAAKQAAAAQAQSDAANRELQREIYGENKSALSPYMQTGNAAMGQINALLGISTPGQVDYGAYAAANPDIVRDYQTNVLGKGAFNSLEDYARYHYDNYGRAENRVVPMTGGSAGGAQAANDAFARFRDSTGYQFRLGEGMNALNTGYAAKGLLNSGAAQKAAIKFGQDYGSAEFGNYLGYLGNQQGLGLSGASALAGVGQGYANSMTAINNNSANAQANIAQARAQNTNALLGNLSSRFGMGLGALSSFGGGFKGTGYTQGALDAGQLF